MTEIQELLEAYRQGSLSRREFICRVIMVAGGLAAALPFLTPLGITKAEAAQVDPNDPALESTPQPLDLLRQIEAPVLAHHGEEDREIIGGVPATDEAMRRFGKSYTFKIYPRAGHAFHNDTRPDRYNPEAAKEAWERTLAFLAQHLKR